jgi:hypothetical protein
MQALNEHSPQISRHICRQAPRKPPMISRVLPGGERAVQTAWVSRLPALEGRVNEASLHGREGEVCQGIGGVMQPARGR